MLLTVFLASATVPALHLWIDRDAGNTLENGWSRFGNSLTGSSRPTRSSIPDWWTRELLDLGWTAGPPPEKTAFGSDLLFPPRALELFAAKGSREGEFAQALSPPTTPRFEANQDGVALRWTSPPGMTAVRTQLGDHPLLQLAYRIYRWRESEAPTLLGAVDITQSFYLDQDLPLWSERFYYCVATVLEGKIDNLPSLIESKPSPVIAVQTPQNYQLQVLGGSPDLAEVEVAVFREGRWQRREFAVSPGSRIGAPTVFGEDSDADFDTGLQVLNIEVREESGEVSVQRPIFLPDGRREVDPASGHPTFRSVNEPVQARRVELECMDPAGDVKRISSSPTR